MKGCFTLKVTLLSHTPEPEKLIAAAAKLCYSDKADIGTLMQSLDDYDAVRGFVRKLMTMHHESPLEHASFTFGIEGVSRSFLAQMTRHRVASFSVRSQRYCSEDTPAFIAPKLIASDEKKKDEFANAMQAAWMSYNQLVEMGAAKEDARAALPNACETRMMVTMNARELLHFFSLRCCSRAQLEIRTAANAMLQLCRKAAPTIFEHAGAACDQLGYCPEGRMSCGRKMTLEEVLRKSGADSVVNTGNANESLRVSAGSDSLSGQEPYMAGSGEEKPAPFDVLMQKKEARREARKAR